MTWVEDGQAPGNGTRAVTVQADSEWNGERKSDDKRIAGFVS